MDAQVQLLHETRHVTPIPIEEVSRLVRIALDLLATCPTATARALSDKLLTLTTAPRRVCRLVAETAIAAAPKQRALDIAA